MSDWAHGLAAAFGVLIGLSCLLGAQFVGPELAGLLRLAAPAAMVGGFVLGSMADHRKPAGSPWLAMAVATPVGGLGAALPWAIAAVCLISQGLSHRASWDPWVGAFLCVTVAAEIVGSSVLIAMATVVVAVVDGLAAWSRRRSVRV